MNQKRFLTLLPILFIVIVILSLVIYYVSYNIEKYGCIGNQMLDDSNLEISLKIPCNWEVDIKKDNKKNNLYSITSSLGEVRILKVNQQMEPEEGDLFVDLGDGIIRFRGVDSSKYFYNYSNEELRFQVIVDTDSESIDTIDKIIKNLYSNSL